MESQNNMVLVIAEHENGNTAAITRELLGSGSKLATSLNGELAALIIGGGTGDTAKEAISYGADKAYVLDNPSLDDYDLDSYISAVTQACQQINPAIILMGHTAIGRDTAARIAFRLKCFPLMDSNKLEYDAAGKSLVQIRLAYSGKAVATMGTTGSFPQLATVSPGVMEPPAPDNSRQGEVINLNIEISDSTPKLKLVDTIEAETGEIKLEEAEVVVAGGGGIGGIEGFEMLKELAGIWNGAVGGTRVPCDEGWLPSMSFEIGLTGKTVKPRLYFAIGISGAAQHIVGCSDSKCIVAINKDPDAAIFKVSDFGIVGDYKTVVPALIEQFKKH